MERLGLHILSGLHAGALIDLGNKPAWSLGWGDGVDILLADDGLAELQCRFAFDAEEEAWTLESCADGIEVFGTALPPEGSIVLRAATQLSASGVDMDVVRLLGAAEPDRPVTILAASDRQRAAARRAVLWQLDRKAYAGAVLHSWRRMRYLPLALLAAGLVVAGVIYQIDRGRAEQEPAREAHDYIRRAFPDVSVDYEKVTGSITYAGYVNAQRDLDYLRTLALAADQGQSVIRVVPMESLAMNTSLLLDEYYRDASVSVTGPGALRVTLAGEDTVKSLTGWNFSAVGALVRRELPELRDVDIAIETTSRDVVKVPRSALHYSVLPTREDTYFAITPGGDRLFAGASVKEGRLDYIGPCVVELSSSGATFSFSSDKTLSCAYGSTRDREEHVDVSTLP